MQTTCIIRERGQLTIPESIRREISWATPMSAVSISIIRPDEIVIKPHVQKVNWEQIWESIRRSRAILGKGAVKSVEFMASDRASH